MVVVRNHRKLRADQPGMTITKSVATTQRWPNAWQGSKVHVCPSKHDPTIYGTRAGLDRSDRAYRGKSLIPANHMQNRDEGVIGGSDRVI